jgi:hypothetical protein
MEVTVPIKCSTVRSVSYKISQALPSIVWVVLMVITALLIWAAVTWETSIGERVVMMFLIIPYAVLAYILSPIKLTCIQE